MDKEDFCQSCKQSHLCREVYEHLGKSRGPSVVLKALCAFLLPLVVFVGSLAVFEKLMARATTGKDLRTVLGVLSAVTVTLVCILITRVIMKRIGKDQ